MPFTINEARVVAKDEMDKWGLLDKGWTYTTDKSTNRHGWVQVPRCTLGLSTVSIQHCSKEEVVDTIRHEIAHALHYQYCVEHNINYMERKYQRTRNGRGRWVRVIPPHGAGWKRFAAMTGATGKAASKTNGNTAVGNWRIVIVKDGTVEDADSNCQRFLKNLGRRYVTGRKDVLGCLYLVKGKDWSQTVSGDRCVNTLKFYQKPNVETRFDNLTLSS